MTDDEKHFERLHALVVDDDQSMISLIATVLQSMGVRRIERALDGDRALEMFQNDPNIVDFVICDWMMPKMSGLELLKQVRKLNSDIPFLMLTAKSTIDAVKLATDAGVSQFLTKPFTPIDL
ncbi:MAG: response regulator, partial [Alphaproteobacteria bacterium]|nr:response regulator [Alphaproteobacteria bacterium]